MVRSLIAFCTLTSLLVGCAPPNSVDEAKQNLEKTAQVGEEALQQGAEKAIAEGQKVAAAQIDQASRWASEITQHGKLSAEAKAWIEKTIKNKDGMVAATVTGPIEEAMNKTPQELGWIRMVLVDKVKNSSGEAEAAWKILLERVDQKIAEQKNKK